MAAVPVISTIKGLRTRVAKWKKEGQRIALVPTMGALHEGHLSLVELARREADRVIVSIFVNPKQFGPKEDFTAYPRDEAGDRAKLKKAGVDVIYAPEAEEIYPDGFSTEVHVGGVSDVLCDASRPGHMDGVATVVTKFLMQTQPDVVLFGEKDWQQLVVTRKLVRDLDIPVKIAAAPIVREDDGLALSSRNAYLSPNEREVAPLLHAILAEAARAISEGRPVETVLKIGKSTLANSGFKVDYFELRDAETLIPLKALDRPARVFAAVHLGKTRLIDNLPIPGVELAKTQAAPQPVKSGKEPIPEARVKAKAAPQVKSGRARAASPQTKSAKAQSPQVKSGKAQAASPQARSGKDRAASPHVKSDKARAASPASNRPPRRRGGA